jgi:hypothetical protein
MCQKGRTPLALDEALLKRLIETPGVPGREEQQWEIAREELGTLTDEVRTGALGSVIGTRRGRDGVRVMVAAHNTDEIGFLVKHIDDKGFLSGERGRRPGRCNPPRPLPRSGPHRRLRALIGRSSCAHLTANAPGSAEHHALFIHPRVRGVLRTLRRGGSRKWAWPRSVNPDQED